MMNSSVQTPNRKRKMLPNIGVECTQSPKKTKLNGSTKPPEEKNYTPDKASKGGMKKSRKRKKKGIKSGKSNKLKRFSGTTQLKGCNEKEFIKIKSENSREFENEASSKIIFSGISELNIKKEKSCESESGAFFKNLKIKDIKKEKSESENETSLEQFSQTKRIQLFKAAKRFRISDLWKKFIHGDKTVLIQLEHKIKCYATVHKIPSKFAQKKLKALNKFRLIFLGQYQQKAELEQCQGSYSNKVRELLLHKDPSLHIQFLEDKIKMFESRPEKTKKAKRKLKALVQLKMDILSGKELAPPTASLKKEQYQQEAEGESLKLTSKHIKKEKEDEFSDCEVETKVQPDEIVISDVKLEEFSDIEDEFSDDVVKTEVQPDEISISSVKLEEVIKEDQFSYNEVKAAIQPEI